MQGTTRQPQSVTRSVTGGQLSSAARRPTRPWESRGSQVARATMASDRLQAGSGATADRASVVTLDTLPLEMIDRIVASLLESEATGAPTPLPDPRPAQPQGPPPRARRRRPPQALGQLAVASRRLRMCCVHRADAVWQSFERAAFGDWQHHSGNSAAAGAAVDNAAAHARYCVRMSCRVRVRAAVWALSKPASLGSIPVRLPVKKGLSDCEIRQRAASVQLPSELVELYRALDGQPVGTDGFQLIIPGFRLLSLAEVFAELNGAAVQDEPPSFAAGGGGGLGGDWSAALATHPDAGFIELPLTAPTGIQRYTVRFPSRSNPAGGYSEAFDAGVMVRCSVRLRGMIGEGQEKSESLVLFLRGLAR
jgi:hypothetical protein